MLNDYQDTMITDIKAKDQILVNFYFRSIYKLLNKLENGVIQVSHTGFNRRD